MKKKFYIILLSIIGIGIQACSNNDIEVLDSTNQDAEGSISSSSYLITSSEAEANIPAFIKAIEAEIHLLEPFSRTNFTSVADVYKEYDFLTQQKITSKEKKGVTYLVQSKMDENVFLALYEEPNGIIINVKKININANDKEATISFSKLNDTFCFSSNYVKEAGTFNILSYNRDLYSTAQTRNGCSIAIGTAGLIWGGAFGVLSFGAGFAAGAIFLAMSEVMC